MTEEEMVEHEKVMAFFAAIGRRPSVSRELTDNEVRRARKGQA